MIVFPEGGELLIALPPQAQWLSVQVPRGRIEAAGLVLSRCLEGSARRMAGVFDAGLMQTLFDLAPVLSPQAQPAGFDVATITIAHDELLASLIGELARRGGASDAGAALSPGERWRVIRRAEAYLDACAEPSVRIDDLCEAACTSLSRLERAFRETFGLSPRRYLMLRRLAAVRRELLRGDAQTSITEVATRWGFSTSAGFKGIPRSLLGTTIADLAKSTDRAHTVEVSRTLRHHSFTVGETPGTSSSSRSHTTSSS